MLVVMNPQSVANLTVKKVMLGQELNYIAFDC